MQPSELEMVFNEIVETGIILVSQHAYGNYVSTLEQYFGSWKLTIFVGGAGHPREWDSGAERQNILPV